MQARCLRIPAKECRQGCLRSQRKNAGKDACAPKKECRQGCLRSQERMQARMPALPRKDAGRMPALPLLCRREDDDLLRRTLNRGLTKWQRARCDVAPVVQLILPMCTVGNA